MPKKKNMVYCSFYSPTYVTALHAACRFLACNALVSLKTVYQTAKHVGDNWW